MGLYSSILNIASNVSVYTSVIIEVYTETRGAYDESGYIHPGFTDCWITIILV